MKPKTDTSNLFRFPGFSQTWQPEAQLWTETEPDFFFFLNQCFIYNHELITNGEVLKFNSCHDSVFLVAAPDCCKQYSLWHGTIAENVELNNAGQGQLDNMDK